MALDFDKDLRELGVGYIYPYHGKKPADRAEQIACGVLHDLCDRRGIKHQLENCDAEVRGDIVTSLAAIIRKGIETASLPQFDDYDALMKHLRGEPT